MDDHVCTWYDVGLDMGSAASGYESVNSCFGSAIRLRPLALGPMERLALFLTGAWYLGVSPDRQIHDVYKYSQL